MNRPEGESLTMPSVSVPQQTMALLGWMPHVLLVPALIPGRPKKSSGSSDWPLPLSPQQVAVPFERMPQVWLDPAATVPKVPLGAVVWP